MNITLELYNKLVPEYPLYGHGEWDEVQNYIIDIDREMKRHCFGLWDCHYSNLAMFYENYLEYWPNQWENYKALNMPRGKYLRRAIDSFTTQLYDLKIIW